MRYRLFQYPLPAPEELNELNGFIAAHRIASVTHHVVSGGGGPRLVFVVEYLDGGGSGPAGGNAVRADYRELLNPAEFAVFSRLRDERKRLAEAEGVPVYTVFTNAQLAEMIRRGVRNEADLAAIDGLGKGRIEKYARHVLPLLAHSGDAKPEDAGE